MNDSEFLHYKKNNSIKKDGVHIKFQTSHMIYKPGMILSNKEKTGKLCNTKSSRPAHVEDMSRVRLRRCAFAGGFGGMLPQENFYFQHGFLDF